jgi:hypothetical protein
MLINNEERSEAKKLNWYVTDESRTWIHSACADVVLIEEIDDWMESHSHHLPTPDEATDDAIDEFGAIKHAEFNLPFIINFFLEFYPRHKLEDVEGKAAEMPSGMDFEYKFDGSGMREASDD